MENNTNVFIADESPDFAEICAQILSMSGFSVTIGEDDGLSAVNAIVKNRPDVAILSTALKSLDGIGVIRRLTESSASVPTKFILTSSTTSAFIGREAAESGAAYFLLKPLDFNLLSERIFRMTKNTLSAYNGGYQFDESNLEYEITKILHSIGIPPHNKGFYYLREAIMLASHDIGYLSKITKSLYPIIAQHFNTTPTCVERDIRHSINVAWNSEKSAILNLCFGCNKIQISEKPSNGELIAVISDALRLQRKVMF